MKSVCINCSMGFLGKILHFVAAVVELLSGVTLLVGLSSFTGLELKTGCNPNAISSAINCGSNLQWFIGFTALVYALLSLFFVFTEVGLVFFDRFFKKLKSDALRGYIYVAKGVAILGLSGDLGIAAGTIEMAVGVVLIVMHIISSKNGSD